MTFKDLEKWEQEGTVDTLKPGENPYVEYTKGDIIDGLRKENKELKRQQKEFIKRLEGMIDYYQKDAEEHGLRPQYDWLMTGYESALRLYKKTIGDDNK